MITQDRLKQLVSYDPETGLFSRLVKTSNTCRMDRPIGTISDGYLCATIDNKRYLLHRLVFLYMNGELPDSDIDHINMVRSDNRFINLRVVSRMANMQNKRLPSRNNKSGFLGVCRYRKTSTFKAQIEIGGKNKHLGYFQTAELAHEAYLSAKRANHEGNTL